MVSMCLLQGGVEVDNFNKRKMGFKVVAKQPSLFFTITLLYSAI